MTLKKKPRIRRSKAILQKFTQEKSAAQKKFFAPGGDVKEFIEKRKKAAKKLTQRRNITKTKKKHVVRVKDFKGKVVK